MLCGDWKQPMVNTVLFTSCASDLLMLIFVLIGNFVVINLFLGVVFYIFFYKSHPRSIYSKDKLQNAIQIILHRQESISKRKPNSKETKIEEPHTSNSGSSEMVSEMQDSFNNSFRKSKKKKLLRNQKEMEIIEDVSSEYMADCCPALCYFCCSFCKADENPVLWQNWADVRCRLYCFVETRLFRTAVSLVIALSVAVLIVDRS
ncbi:Sodium channel protein para, partial [Stegodyphus mimosarum]